MSWVEMKNTKKFKKYQFLDLFSVYIKVGPKNYSVEINDIVNNRFQKHDVYFYMTVNVDDRKYPKLKYTIPQILEEVRLDVLEGAYKLWILNLHKCQLVCQALEEIRKGSID